MAQGNEKRLAWPWKPNKTNQLDILILAARRA